MNVRKGWHGNVRVHSFGRVRVEIRTYERMMLHALVREHVESIRIRVRSKKSTKGDIYASEEVRVTYPVFLRHSPKSVIVRRERHARLRFARIRLGLAR